MNHDPGPSRASTPAEDLYAEYVLRVSDGIAQDFDGLCAAHPEHAAELRVLHARDSGAKARQHALELGPLPASLPLASTRSAAILDELRARGAHVARYRIVEPIGAGGMGTVYEAEDVLLGRTVALKVITDTGRARDLLPAFDREMRIAARISHPGVAGIHDAGVDEQGRAFFTMPLVRGRDLRDVFRFVQTKESGWSVSRAVGVLRQVCETMAYVHSRGVIHRDLKPSNIRVGDYGEVFVMDWGLAKGVTEQEAAAGEILSKPLIGSLFGRAMGTPAYMSPEQARGEVSAVGPPTDVYALGAMLYELLAGREPYREEGEESDSDRELKRVRAGPPAALERVNRSAPAELVAICERAMARDVNARYADMNALAADLGSFLEGRVVSAYETGTWAETKKWVTRNRALATALGAALVIAITGVVWIGTKNSELRAANTTIELRSVDLANSTRVAEENATRAKEQEKLATQRASELAVATALAQEKEREATQKANDVLSLSAIQDLKDLEDRADELWPADPEMLPKYADWLADARVLIEGRPAKDGLKGKPSLAQHEAKLAELRRQAKDRTTEQIDDDRKASPSYVEWEKALAELHWKRRMLREEPWPVVAEVEAALAQDKLPTDANGLNNIAWKLVDIDPAKIVYGSEIRGLILATRAVAAANDAERGGVRDTLAWALFRCGRFEEALVEEQKALEEANGNQKAELAGSLERLEDQIGLWKDEEARAKQSVSVAKLSARVTELQQSVDARRTYDFDDGEARWWEAQLSKLVLELKSFSEEKSGGLFSSGTSVQHGWGIVKRAEFAASIEKLTLSGADAKNRWSEASASIAASPKYGGLELEPQLGLLPIGADPASGLWEFWHVQSGEEPKRGEDGKLIPSEKMGIVLVLIPGGMFTLGAQAQDPTGPNYDPAAQADEPPYEVTLDAYFLSKYEMTQGQWSRFVGRNPSYYGPLNYGASWNREGKAWNGLHPVETVSWNDCARMLRRLGLELPTEAQWEHGCRGSTSSVYWSGDDPTTLVDAGNVADQFMEKVDGGFSSAHHELWDDGNAVHAVVGSYRANELGLHDTHGNVFEWCRDGYGPTTKWLAGSGERDVPGASYRVIRGGCFSLAASDARTVLRIINPPESQYDYLGLRPARASRLSASPTHPPRK